MSPQWFSAEVKTGFWLPSNANVQRFYDKCCNLIPAGEFGFLYDSKYGVEVGLGFFRKTAAAIGLQSQSPSTDTFTLLLLPAEWNLTYRADYFENQILVPYVKGGFDAVYFREEDVGKVTKGVKYGYHAIGGLQILMEWFDEAGGFLEREGINDVYLTLEARYARIDDFGRKGLDLSGWIYSAGLLFEF